MGEINKPILLPLASGIFLLVKQLFGIEVAPADQEVYVNAVLALITLVGVFMKFKKQ